jgi:lipase
MPLQHPADFPTWVSQFGKGPRQALFIHCSLAHSGAWTGLAGQLGDLLSITAFDVPGHGRSADWDGVTDIHGLSLRIARDLIGEGPVDLVGHSFGGTVATRLAIEYPHLVRSLTLIEPVFFSAAIAAGRPEALENVGWYDRFCALRAQGLVDLAAQIFTDHWGTGADWQGLSVAQRSYITDRIGLIEAADHVLYHDRAGLLARLPQVRCPVLLLDGTQTPVVMNAIIEELMKLLPQAQRARIERAAHMLPITHPAEVATAMRRFYAGKAQQAEPLAV